MFPASVTRWASDQRALFVVVNLAVNLLFIVRSYVAMLVLDYRDLGLVALLQSIVLLIGVLQFGFLNGGYRLICAAEEDEAVRINNLVYTFIAILGAIALVAAGMALIWIGRREDGLVGLLGVIGGVATLARTWMTNQMIVSGGLSRLNAINLGSALASLACFALLPFDALLACMASIVVQPVAFAAAVWLVDRRNRPSRFSFSVPLARRVIATGFVIFLSGMLLQVNIQLERWYAVGFLGIDALGHLFFAIMFATLFQLVPNSLDALFLPRLVRAHRAGEYVEVAHGSRQYLLLLIGYSVLALAALGLLGAPVVNLVLPRYVGDLLYVYLVAPGVALLAISSAFAIIFTVLIRYRYTLVAYAGGAIGLAATLGWSIASGSILTLVELSIARSAMFALTALLVVCGWLIITREHKALRFGSAGR